MRDDDSGGSGVLRRERGYRCNLSRTTYEDPSDVVVLKVRYAIGQIHSHLGARRSPNNRRRLTFAAELDPFDLVDNVGDG
jgi:hypothetical protein